MKSFFVLEHFFGVFYSVVRMVSVIVCTRTVKVIMLMRLQLIFWSLFRFCSFSVLALFA